MIRWQTAAHVDASRPVHHHARPPDWILECDASDSAVACIVVRCPEQDAGAWRGQRIRRELRARERTLSSTLRELIGYAHGIRSLVRRGALRRGMLIEIVGDSACAAAIFLKGGSQAAYDEIMDYLPLLEELMDIFVTALAAGCEVRMRWTRRCNIKAADALSKEHDHHDFGLRPHLLARAATELGWGPDALQGSGWVDRFAAPHNAVCRRFVCLYATDAAGAVGADALGMDWSAGYSYVLPPFEMVDRVLDKIEADNAEALVIVPRWTSKSWWWRLRSGAWQDRIVATMELPVDALVPFAENAEHCFFGHRFDAPLLAFRTRRL